MGPTIDSELERLRDFVATLDAQIKECEESIVMNPHGVNPGNHRTGCKEMNDACVAKSHALAKIGRLALR